jgi:hypothetical protein
VISAVIKDKWFPPGGHLVFLHVADDDQVVAAANQFRPSAGE